MISGDAAAQVRGLLEAVRDPEIPVLSIADLGILRDVHVAGNQVDVTITPTYTACPAMTQIEDDIRGVLRDAGWQAQVITRLSPAWTTDWLTPEARDKLRGFGIAAPRSRPCTALNAAGEPRLHPRRVIPIASFSIAKEDQPTLASGQHGPEDAQMDAVPCPLCGSADTEELARFGSTACKALYRCRTCHEAFDYFKPY